jgi:hypothetical protein
VSYIEKAFTTGLPTIMKRGKHRRDFNRKPANNCEHPVVPSLQKDVNDEPQTNIAAADVTWDKMQNAGYPRDGRASGGDSGRRTWRGSRTNKPKWNQNLVEE